MGITEEEKKGGELDRQCVEKDYLTFSGLCYKGRRLEDEDKRRAKGGGRQLGIPDNP